MEETEPRDGGALHQRWSREMVVVVVVVVVVRLAVRTAEDFEKQSL